MSVEFRLAWVATPARLTWRTAPSSATFSPDSPLLEPAPSSHGATITTLVRACLNSPISHNNKFELTANGLRFRLKCLKRRFSPLLLLCQWLCFTREGFPASRRSKKSELG